jgi:YbbR domain-containing protein
LVDAAPSHGPPEGYRITSVSITPLTVEISGDPAAVGRIRSIVLPSVDLSSNRADVTIRVNVSYPSGITSDVETATIKYTIAKNPNVP